MKKSYYYLILLLFIVSTGSYNLLFAHSKKEKDKKEESTQQPIKEKVLYKKIFKDQSKLTTSKGVMTIYQYDDKIYLELPLKLIGRDYLTTSNVLSASDLALTGARGTNPSNITVDRTDSLVLFRKPRYNYRLNENDANQKKAFEQSNISAIYKTFPIAAYSADSTAILFDATSFLTAANKDFLDLKGNSYGEGVTINDASIQSKLSFIEAS